MNFKHFEEYLAPEIEIMHICAEGVLCASTGSDTELLDEIDGVW